MITLNSTEYSLLLNRSKSTLPKDKQTYSKGFMDGMAVVHDIESKQICRNCDHYTHFKECELLSYEHVGKYSEDTELIFLEREPKHSCSDFKKK